MSIRYLTTSILVGVLLVSGCGIYSRYERPNVGVEFEEEVKAPSWRQMYTDPLLQNLIDTALTNASSLQIARTRTEEAEAVFLKSKMQFLPSLGASATADLKGGDASAGLNAAWQADIFGKQRNASLASKAALEQSQAYEQATTSALIATVARGYYNLLILDSRLDISLRTLENWDKSISVLESLKAAGKTNSIAILQAKAKRLNLESSIEGLRNSIASSNRALCALIGVEERPVKRAALTDSSPCDDLFADLPLRVAAARPDVREAEMALAEAFYQTAAARSAFYPDISLSGSAALSSGLDGVIWSALAGLSAPILNRGNSKAGLKAAQARQEAARQNFRQTLLDAGVEIGDALGQCKSASDRMEIDARQRDLLAEAVEKIELTMRYSSANYLEVLTAQQSLLDAELSLVGDRQSYLDACISLYQAIGGM